MKLDTLFKRYGPDNDIHSLEQKARNSKTFIFMSKLVSGVVILLGATLIGSIWGLFASIMYVLTSTTVCAVTCSEIEQSHSGNITRFKENTSNEHLLQFVETNLVKNIKKEIARALDSEKVRKCEAYIIAIHTVQQFLIDEEKKNGSNKDLMDNPHIELLKVLNDQKFALQKFIDEFEKKGEFIFDNLTPVPQPNDKEEYFLLLPKSIFMDNYHTKELADFGISEDVLGEYNLTKGVDLPALNMNKEIKKKFTPPLTLLNIDEQKSNKAQSVEVSDFDLFKNVHILIEKIESEYIGALTHEQAQEFDYIKNERLPEIANLYDKIKNLSDKEYFQEGLIKTVEHIEVDLKEVITHCRESLMKEIRVIEHTSKMKHRA